MQTYLKGAPCWTVVVVHDELRLSIWDRTLNLLKKRGRKAGRKESEQMVTYPGPPGRPVSVWWGWSRKRVHHRRLASRKWLAEEIMEREVFGADPLGEASSQETVETRPEVDGHREPYGPGQVREAAWLLHGWEHRRVQSWPVGAWQRCGGRHEGILLMAASTCTGSMGPKLGQLGQWVEGNVVEPIIQSEFKVSRKAQRCIVRTKSQ